MRRREGTLVPLGSPMMEGSGIGAMHARDKEMGRGNLMSFRGGGGGERGWFWSWTVEGAMLGEMSWMEEETSRALVPTAIHMVVAKVMTLKADFIKTWVRLG